MKTVTYVKNGRNYLSTIRDRDTDPSIGFLQSPPDIDGLDWEEIKRILHNLLVEKKLFEIEDVQQRTVDLNWCVHAAITRPLFRLYQEHNQQHQEAT